MISALQGFHWDELNDHQKNILDRYASTDSQSPYVIIGIFYPKKGHIGGLLCFADNEMFAYILKRELSKSGKNISVQKTKYHPDGPTFDLNIWMNNLALLHGTN